MGKTITFERRLTASYMVITTDNDGGLDEKIMLRRKIPGLLPMEKCFADGCGQYWYCISGKQSLDTFCRLNRIDLAFMEKLVVSVCAQVEIVSRNLMSTNCILLSPEQIYVSNATEELIFTLCPGENQELQEEFRKLMEYLLTKLDHEDQNAVQMAYKLYEKTLDEHYSLTDLRDSIAEARVQKAQAEEAIIEVRDHVSEANKVNSPEAVKKGATAKEAAVEEVMGASADGQESEWELEQKMQEIWGKLQEIWTNWKEELQAKRSDAKKKKTKKVVYYPQECEAAEEESEPQPAVHPTICLSDYREHPDGMLLYEGYERFSDVKITGRTVCIGQGSGVDISIEKETISHLHAQIVYEEGEYYIEDLNSTNGTQVNGELLPYRKRRKLVGNDIVQFADVRYRFL